MRWNSVAHSLEVFFGPFVSSKIDSTFLPPVREVGEVPVSNNSSDPAGAKVHGMGTAIFA